MTWAPPSPLAHPDPSGDRTGSQQAGDESPRAGGAAELWAAYAAGRDNRTRDELVTCYYPLVKHLARRIASSLGYRVDLGDLEGYGAEGLLDAVDRFDAARGAQFSTFAAHRIRGAIYDGVRAGDWAPRSLRRREREIHTNFGWLCTEHGRVPTEDEEALALGVDVDALRSSKRQIAGARVTSLEGASAGEEGPAEPRDPAAEPVAKLLADEEAATLRAALEQLDERERQVTTMSFHEGLTLAEIGERLGVTESRVSQIRSAAIQRLRAYARANGLAQA